MHAYFRTVLCGALAVAFAAQAAPASAAFSYLTPAQAKAQRCLQSNKAGNYSSSLQICLDAAATFKQAGDAEKRNPWYSYEVEGMMLEAAALDYSALGRHHEALETALEAHRLLLYTYRTYPMDPSDRTELSSIAARVARLADEERGRR